MSDPNETLPPTSGVVEADLRVVVCSQRIGLVGSGSAVLAHDAAELLMAIDDHPRVAIVIDAAHSPIELAFFARLARDFPPSVSIFVEGDPAADRRTFHEHGVYRPRFEGRGDGVLPDRDGIVDGDEIVARVIELLERQPTPPLALRR